MHVVRTNRYDMDGHGCRFIHGGAKFVFRVSAVINTSLVFPTYYICTRVAIRSRVNYYQVISMTMADASRPFSQQCIVYMGLIEPGIKHYY